MCVLCRVLLPLCDEFQHARFFFFVLGGPDDGHDLKNSFNHNRILRFYKASEAKVNTRESLMHGSLPPEGDVFASIGMQGAFYRVFLTS